MRNMFIVVTAVALLAGCAVASKPYTAASDSGKSEFVGTSAKAPPAHQPSWYRFGHP